MGDPQVILLTMMILSVLIVPANDETYWKFRYSLGVRLLRVALLGGLLWWGGFWTTGA